MADIELGFSVNWFYALDAVSITIGAVLGWWIARCIRARRLRRAAGITDHGGLPKRADNMPRPALPEPPAAWAEDGQWRTCSPVPYRSIDFPPAASGRNATGC
jgi:hypothetical protein